MVVQHLVYYLEELLEKHDLCRWIAKPQLSTTKKGSHIKGEVMQPLGHDAKPFHNLHRLHLWEHFVY